ncbi:MAG TPA: glycosyltransferase [Pseudomonadales bacterium]|nr:glycosyltransferase [Pseudomonadales bacterium]
MNMPAAKLEISVVIPVYNEEVVLEQLFARLYPAMDELGRSYEVIFVDDGSRDKSPAMLRQQYQARPDETKVVLLRANAGQHAALMAGFSQCAGTTVVTLDADLQNPPEEIGKLVAKIDEGHDYVGSIRRVRRDSWWRHYASRLMNIVRERITRIRMTDQGCMLRAYHRDIVSAMLASTESQTFIPALGYLYARDPAEVVVEHSERVAGESKYSLWKLIQLNFDLVTGFSIVPLQVFSLLGLVISVGSFLLVCLLVARRLILGPEVEGVFTLFAIAFFMIGLLLSAVGILGEYVGRIYVEVRKRPQYVIAAVLGREDSGEADNEGG